ncbi:DNA polymerase I [Pontimonas sp.]|nr:DNA polymerase I [Pontimonas sp.]MDA8863292.1 DNA polymerase I [Pontimonas sp.]
MAVSDKPTLMVIDGHSLAFRAFYALPVDSFVSPDGQHTNAIHGFISMFLGLLKKENPTHVAVAFDISRFSFRTRIYPEYKATRGETPSEFIGQVPLLQEALAAMGVVTLTKEDYEADDILATLAHQAGEKGFDVLVVSGDRDTFQLVNDRVTVLYPSARGVAELKRYTPSAVEERYGVPPHKYPDVAALVGETSDNLVGVDKVGEKTAVKWITQFGSLDSVLEHADEISGVVGQNLRDQRDRAIRNRQLNRLLTDVALDITLEDLERGIINPEAVSTVFTNLGFKTLKTRVLELAGVTEGETAPTIQADVRQVELPVERTLVDEELQAWLQRNSTDILGLSVRSNGGVVEAVGLASQSEAIRVPWTPGSADHEPLLTRLREHDAGWVCFDGKETIPSLAAAVGALTLAGDVRVGFWVGKPSAKAPTFASMVGEILGLDIPQPDPNQLVPEEDALPVGVDAWLVRALWLRVLEDLTPSSASVLRDIELPLVSVLAAMESLGIASNRRELERISTELAAQSAAHQADAYAAIGREVNLGSPKQLQTVLFEELGMPKTRATKTGYTTDAKALQELQLSHPHPFLDALLAHRDSTKLHQIVEGLIASVTPDGRIHTTFDQTGTSTGRLSSSDPNLQNIPVRTDVGHQIRSTFVASGEADGLLTADYSQIEMRIMAHLSEDAGLIEAFQGGEDLHRFVGARIFDVSPDDVTPLMRTKVKAMSYGLAYGLSAYGLAQQLAITPSEAKELMSEYFRRFGNVRDYLRTVVEKAKQDGFTETLFGRRRPFPDLASPNRIVREAAERQALNAPIQGTAADIIKIAMRDISDDIDQKELRSRMVLQVHDELVFEVFGGERAKLEEIVVNRMGGAATLMVPLDVQLGWGANWDEAAH